MSDFESELAGESTATLGPPAKGGRTGRFLHNLMWVWASVGLTVVSGFLAAPFIIHRIGDDNYGVWALVLSLIEYYWLLDFGFRSATLKYTAHYYVLGDTAQVNRVINTGLAYSSAVAAVMLAATWIAAPHLGSLFKITHPDFPRLILIIGVSWSAGMVFNAFGAGLEGLQRYDITSRVGIVMNGLRVLAVVILVSQGYGLLQMALALLVTQMILFGMYYLRFRQIFPPLRISVALATFGRMRELASFGVHTFTITVAMRILNQSTPLLIAAFLPARFVSFYVVPLRVLDAVTNAVGQFGMVTGSNTAELVAKKEWTTLTDLSVYSNRYCAALSFSVAVFLWTYGAPLFAAWIRPDYAMVLPVLVIGMAAANSQYNSTCVLTNMARQKWYARGLMAEALLSLAGMWYAIPRFGILGAAWVASGLMVANRGVLVAWLLARELKIPLGAFAWRVYAAPTAIALLVFGLLAGLRRTVLPGANWPQLALAAAIGFSAYGALAVIFCLRPSHREFLFRRLRELGRGGLIPT